jgi:hypothetical protein
MVLRSAVLAASIALFAAPLAWAKSDKGDEAAAKSYQLDTSGTTTTVTSGGAGVLKLQIKPAAGYKVSFDAPLKIALTSAELKLSKADLGKADVEDKKGPVARFSVPFEAAGSGNGTIAAEASFFICSDTVCERKVDRITVAVEVKPR